MNAKEKPPIGGIGQYAVLGSGKKNLTPQTSKQQEDETLKLQSVKELQPLDAKALKLQDDKELKRQTVYLPKRLARRLKVHAATTDQDMSEIVVYAVMEYLDRHEENERELS